MPSITNSTLSFWSRLLSFFKPPEWDPHGLAGNVVLEMNELSEFKKYKVSDVTLIDNLTSESVDGCTLKPGDILTKSQVQEKLEYLDSWEAFETLKLESKTKPDGTIGITIYFMEVCWSAPDRIKFINVGLMDAVECTTSEKEPQETSMEKYIREEGGYKRRMDMSRPCMLPASIQREILDMLVVEETVTPRLLLKIIDKVTRWYWDKGYFYAEVVCFWNFDTNELVCEVVEGDITQVAVEFHDMLGNVLCEEKPQYEEVRKELRKYLSKGKVYNKADAEQAMDYIYSSVLFYEIEVYPSLDVKNTGGVLIEIVLREL